MRRTDWQQWTYLWWHVVVMIALCAVVLGCPLSQRDLDTAKEIIDALQTPTAVEATQTPVATQGPTNGYTPSATAMRTSTPQPATPTPTLAATLAPTATLTPGPPTAPPSLGPVDLSDVWWAGRDGDPSRWPETVSIDVTFKRGLIYMTGHRPWPSLELRPGVVVNANPWVIAKVGDRWHGATWEFLKTSGPRMDNKPIEVVRGDHAESPPLSGNWRPLPGDTVGIFVSCVTRGRKSNGCRERSNVQWVTWP